MNDTVDGNADDATPQKGQPKALRFVTNYGAPHPKRRRIGAACLTCRKRKTACSGERPHCETCKQNKLDCAGYSSENVATKQKRGPSSPPARQLGTSKVSRKEDRGGDSRPERQDAASHAAWPHSPSSSRYDGEDSTAYHDQEGSHQEPLFSGPRNRMPYFRWLGPTAIMPGFKQMVVKVKRSDTDAARSSNDGRTNMSPSLNANATNQAPSIYSGTPATADSDMRSLLNLPFYDTSPVPPSELITHLANTFFTHLGCNYPFLQRERFLRDLQEKQVDAILVDAVCALAARFSTHPLLKQQPNDENKLSPAEYGHAFAVRARTALVDTFPCPSVAAVQAALLLAYNEFGESRDSGLWMYLGIAIRMAQDLGMHKLEGLKYKGRTGPTPKMVKRESLKPDVPVKVPHTDAERPVVSRAKSSDEDTRAVVEQKAVEQERVDTFWAVFFLDRVVSSGTGRRSTLRDKDIELSFPDMADQENKSAWPAPFPALIRIVHLYGRVADLLNSVKEPSDINLDTPKRLAAMEHQVTQFYQGLSARLHFDAVNFQHYMKAGEGTNFVLLHFWFHTLIVLLHQPTLLKTFEGRMLQLFPNSQQLSMSSAKTIADILSYSQLMDAKASLGNPFTTQPIYIAACAFLKETAEQTATSNAQSQASSPGRKDGATSDALHSVTNSPKRSSAPGSPSGKRFPTASTEHKSLSKHTLLATAATQHYQLCYKALQSLETYWAGTKYILTVLNQKFEGVGDPLLYTAEESESALERPRPEPAFTSPGWRRKMSWGAYGGALNLQSPFFRPKTLSNVPGSPNMDPGRAIGWTLTGTMNSPSTNLAWHYPSGEPIASKPNKDTSSLDLPASSSRKRDRSRLRTGRTHSESVDVSDSRSTQVPVDPSIALRPLAASFGDLAAPATAGTTTDPSLAMQASFDVNEAPLGNEAGHASFQHTMDASGQSGFPLNDAFAVGNMAFEHGNMQNFGDMTIQSQDVDMSMLGGLDMMPWFDSYPTHDVMRMFHNADAEEGAGNHDMTGTRHV